VKKPIFVLDSFALPAYFQAEPAALKVKEILRQARDQEVTVFLSLISLGEIISRLNAGWVRSVPARFYTMSWPCPSGWPKSPAIESSM